MCQRKLHHHAHWKHWWKNKGCRTLATNYINEKVRWSERNGAAGSEPYKMAETG